MAGKDVLDIPSLLRRSMYHICFIVTGDPELLDLDESGDVTTLPAWHPQNLGFQTHSSFLYRNS